MGIFRRFSRKKIGRVRKFRHNQTGITIELDLDMHSVNVPDKQSSSAMSTEEALQTFYERMLENPSPTSTIERPLVDEAIDTVEGVSHDFGEESSVDEIFAHHIRRRFFRSRDTTQRGRMLTITILGFLRDGSIAWIGDDSSAYGNCDEETLGLESPQVGDEVRAKIVSHAWGHTIAAVDPRTRVSVAEVESRATRQVVSAPGPVQPAPANVLGSWRALLKPGDVVLAHVSFDGTYGYRGGALSKNRPAAFVGWGDEFAIVRPIYGLDTLVARNDVAEPLLERGCLIKDSAIRRTAYDIHPDFLLKKLGRLGDRDIVRFGFGRATSHGDKTGSPKKAQGAETANPPRPKGPTPVLFSASSEPWKVACREAAIGNEKFPFGRSPDELLVLYLQEICRSAEVWVVLNGPGIDFAALATALKMLCDARGLTLKGDTFAMRMNRAIPAFNELSDRKVEAVSSGEDLVWYLREVGSD